jgi:uncharacterized protein YqgV (UPF0045/DUF77 family)
MIVAFSVSPSGGEPDGGVSEAVARAVKVVRESGLPNSTNAMFTNAGEGSARVGLVLKADIRPGFADQLEAKVDRIEAHLRDS